MKKTVQVLIIFIACALFLTGYNSKKSKTESAANKPTKNNLPNVVKPKVLDTLVVPAPSADEEVFRTVGDGFQVYIGLEKDGKFEWSKPKPVAELFTPENLKYAIGKHGFDTTSGGKPFWHLFKDNSMVVATPEIAVDAPNPKMNIKWVKLNPLNFKETTGMLSRTVKIYRIHTLGGQPTHIPTAADVNKPDSSHYTADYLFYLKKN